MTDRRYAHVILGVPTAVRSEIAAYLNDDTRRGERLRELLHSLHPDRICQVTLGGTVYHIYTITVDDDTDAGNIRLLLDRWSTIRIVAAFKQDGVQLGQTRVRDENGGEVIIGTPKYSITQTQYNLLKASWPVEFVVNNSMLIPTNIMQGQIIWAL